MKFKTILILISFFAVLSIVNVVNADQNFVTINATSCTDSGGNCNVTNVQSQDGVTESQAGHNSAVRYIETTNNNSSAITSPDSIDNVTVYIDRFESANPGGQTITLQVRRPSDNTASSCTLSAKTANDSVYNGCDVTTLVTGSSDPESDAESLTISYRVQALGNTNTFYLDHSYVNMTYTDSSGPTIILDNPVNNTWNNTNTITFFFTPNDVTSGISSCTLVIDNALNQTSTSIIENQENNITTSLNEGAHTWTVNCTDTSANANIGTNTTHKTINVDLTRLNVQLNLPSDNAVILSSNLTFNFTTTDNLSPTTNCSVYLDNILNQTNPSVSNNTLTNFIINGISQGSHQWNITCSDLANNSNSSIKRTFTVNVTPILTSVSDSPDPVKGGNVITITASGVDDPNNDTLYLYCSESSTVPTSTNSNCTGGTTTDTSPPYSLTCTYATATDDTTHTTYCRVFDGTHYSSIVNTTYTTDSTPPTTSIVSVAGDTTVTYYDNVNDGKTDMLISGEANMVCRYGTSDVVYSSMTNDCTITGTQANCSATTTTQGLDAYNFYVSCQDSLGNGQNSTQNLDITALVHDWTAPTTSDNSSTTVTVPNYVVKITESDNIFSTATITTKYCTDTTGSCTPDTAIDDSGTLTFTSSNRGINFLRYNSSDPASNVQTIQNKTININQLPVFTSASDNATTIKGGSGVKITTVSSDADSGQTLKLYVCNSTSVNSSGCTHTTYCSNTTATTNVSCPFASETDDTTHTWYAFIYDELNESSTTNTSGTYITDSTTPAITIVNPQNQTYSENSVSIQLSLSETGNLASYSLDNAANVTMSNSTPTFWSVTLSGLSNGAHTLRFYANDSYGNMGTNNRVFSVDTTLTDTNPPSITVWSPLNGTYYTSTSVLANITLSENGSNASYSLDSQANVSMGNVSLINWNKTLTLIEGRHNITFYANDTSSNRNTGNSSTIFFTVDITAPQNVTQGFTPSPVNDTTNITCFVKWNDDIELDYGMVQHNETTATNSSQITLANTGNWTNFTISASDTSPGIVECKVYVFDKSGLVNTTSIIINITDTTFPLVENITYIPNTADTLDPTVMVNFTVNVSDNVGLSKVLLQYKLTNETVWNENQMTADGGTGYRGNFTPATGNYSFRIFANDTSNNTNTTSITNISVEQDRTWVNVTTIPTTKSIVQTQPRVVDLGNLTLNNTGDFDLNFTITSNRNWVTFNGTNISLIFIVNSSLNHTIFNVTANTTGFAVGSYTYNITINSYTLNPTLVSSQTLNGTVVVQNVAGPYLIVSITTYDATVTQGDTGVDLSASLENAGTGDATGTWLAWSLPSGWTNTSGVLNRSVGFLGVGSTVTNDIIVSISSSASTGSQTITAFAGSAEATGSDSKTVTVSAASGTSSPTTSGGVSGSAAPAITPEEQALLLQTNETLELVRGLNDTFTIKVTNPFRYTNLTNVSLDVKGFLAQYIGLSPDTISGIEYNKTGFFKVTITAPTYLTKGSHTLNFTITGRMTGALIRDVVEKRLVTLLVHEVSREESNTTLQQAEQAINEMKDAGFSVTTLQRLFEQATKSFDERDYEKVKDLSEKIASIKDTAFATHTLIQEVKEKIKQAEERGLRADATKNLLNMALAAFEREDYSTAERRTKDAQLVYAMETGGKINIIRFLIDNWWEVLIFLGVFSLAGIIVYRRTIVVIIKRRLKDLAVEEASILELMKDIQRKTFLEKTMSSTEYHKAIYEYEKRLNDIKQLRTRLRTKRVGIIKVSKERDSLQKEDEDIVNQIKDVQRDYFEKRSISKATYERRMESLKLTRAEIEEALAALETKVAKEKRLKELEKSKIKPEKTEIQKIEKKAEERHVKRISKPSPVSELFKKVKAIFQEKLSEQAETLERRQIETQYEQALRDILKKRGFAGKLIERNIIKEVGSKIKRLIGKFKSS